ncbi:hypothetical protein BKA63DRAFT_419262 [Paraphoma chrysanthemicola]|nr:hypothetical protein BKA63DRAFT_419262 [Paraphoma chrysanthemicola]
MRTALAVDPNKKTVTKPPIYKEIDRYSIDYDLDEYVAGKESLTRPSELFEVFTTITIESRSKIIRIPALDKLRDQLFLEAQTNKLVTLDTVPELYESCVTSDLGTNNVTFTVTMLQPDIICRAADSYDEKDPTNLQYKNLTFAKRNINSKLPFIFSRMRFTMSWDAMEITGVVREFDPTMVGCVGKRINIAGNYKDPTLTLKRASIVAATFGGKAESALEEMSAAHHAPSLIAVRLAATANKVPTDLIAGAKALHDLALDSKQVNSASQDMLLSMVKFHMTDDDRQQFIGEQKPAEGDEVGQLPVDLGTNLEENAKEWVKGTYIPAFIGRMIIETDAATKKTWRRSLTAQEEKKIAYFWTGKGKTCLSQSKIYTRLNEIAQRNAILRQPTTGARLKECLADTVKDTDGATGGKKWYLASFLKIST